MKKTLIISDIHYQELKKSASNKERLLDDILCDNLNQIDEILQDFCSRGGVAYDPEHDIRDIDLHKSALAASITIDFIEVCNTSCDQIKDEHPAIAKMKLIVNLDSQDAYLEYDLYYNDIY